MFFFFLGVFLGGVGVGGVFCGFLGLFVFFGVVGE